MEIEFTKRKDRNKRQVRFWSYPELYESFTNICDDKGLFIQDVFTDFMRAFVDANRNGNLKIKEPDIKDES